MQTTVTKRGQIAIPVEILKRYSLKAGDNLQWLDDAGGIRLVPVPDDPIRALRGSGKGEGLTKRLIAARREDKRYG